MRLEGAASRALLASFVPSRHFRQDRLGSMLPLSADTAFAVPGAWTGSGISPRPGIAPPSRLCLKGALARNGSVAWFGRKSGVASLQ